MGFMQNEVTAKQTWLELDGHNGITFVPFDVLNSDEVDVATETKYDISEAIMNETFGHYYDGWITDVSLRVGFGARISAPGYMDCTEWDVYDTAEQAESALDETYGDDEEESSEDSEDGVAASIHVFRPDHNLFCTVCGMGELSGEHGMIPGDGGASGTDFSPMYENDAVRIMYDAELSLSEFEEDRPDYVLRASDPIRLDGRRDSERDLCL